MRSLSLSLLLFLYPPPPLHPHPTAPPLSLSGRKSGSIADPMVWPMLYLSGQAMILSALNVIYSKRLPKSTQRDPLTQRSGLSHKHLSLPLSAWWRAHTAIRTSVDTRFYARMYKERACTQAHKRPHTHVRFSALPPHSYDNHNTTCAYTDRDTQEQGGVPGRRPLMLHSQPGTFYSPQGWI